jgi:hypothetical protein
VKKYNRDYEGRLDEISILPSDLIPGNQVEGHLDITKFIPLPSLCNLSTSKQLLEDFRRAVLVV